MTSRLRQEDSGVVFVAPAPGYRVAVRSHRTGKGSHGGNTTVYYRVHAEVHGADGCAGAWEFEARYSHFHKMHEALAAGIALGAREGMAPDGSGRLRIGGMTLPPFPPKQKISFNLGGLGPRLRGDKDGSKQRQFVRKRRAALHTYISSLARRNKFKKRK